MDWYLIIAVLLGVGPAIGLIITENELQQVRLRVVHELRTTLFKEDSELPQLELIEKRYRQSASDQDSVPGLDGKPRQALTRRWSGAGFYAVVNFTGFALLLTPLEWLIGKQPSFPQIGPSAFWGDGVSPQAPDTVLIASFAFVGAFVFQIRYLVRATLNQELSALTFIRASITTLIGVLVAEVAYLAIKHGASDIPGLSGNVAGNTKLGLSMVLAFFIGFWPDLGITMVGKWLKLKLKRIDDSCLDQARVIPLEVIDGIDTETSTRLQESNLYDVQNLATINPIELYVETPYTLFETFDWVIQAQLCTNVGCTAFFELRKYNIRTIFDLERAVLASGAPKAYVAGIGAVLFASASDDFKGRTHLAAAAEAGASDDDIVAIVRHAVAIVCDDVHIHRLRKLWSSIMQSTGGNEAWLYHPGPLPGEA
jgi:hypothetical protein